MDFTYSSILIDIKSEFSRIEEQSFLHRTVEVISDCFVCSLLGKSNTAHLGMASETPFRLPGLRSINILQKHQNT
jgi:hypothetical protein